MLVERITDEEIENVVWSCDSSKSPSLDGFNFGFIKYCWEDLKKDIFRAVHSFKESGQGGRTLPSYPLFPKWIIPNS